MRRVWAIRSLRARIQKRLIRQREEDYLSGRPASPLTEGEALAEMQAERDEILEELEQARRWLRLSRAQELWQTLEIVNEYIEFWRARLDSRA
jgi:hypothetical protein